jgi:hypothetical protein
MKNFKVPILAITLSLFLNGCIGTALLRDSDTTKPYPNLHSVPDAHPGENMRDIQNTIQNVEQQSNHQVDENKQLRLRHGLLIEEKKPVRLFSRKKSMAE